MRKTLGLALGAGAARGIAHIGLLQALEDAGIRPDFIVGSSMGSIVGACYASGMSPCAIRDAMVELRALDIVNLSLLPVTQLGFLKWSKVRRIIAEYMGGEHNIEDLPIPYGCVAVDINSGELRFFREGSVIDAMLASSSMPTIFRPVELDGKKYVDGGVLCRVPVRQVKEMGADVVVAVDVMGQVRPQEKIGSVVSLITRVYDIMDANNTEKYRKETADITDLWLEPDMGDANAYKLKYDPEIYEAGYRCGKENAETILRLLGD